MSAGIVRPCALHLKRALNATLHGTALQPSSDVPLLVRQSSSDLDQLGECMKLRMKVLKAFSQHQPDSAAARAAVKVYLEQGMPGCRHVQSQAGAERQQEVAAVHLHLIHAVRGHICQLLELFLVRMVTQPSFLLCCL